MRAPLLPSAGMIPRLTITDIDYLLISTTVLIGMHHPIQSLQQLKQFLLQLPF